jgi:hypothetical protein
MDGQQDCRNDRKRDRIEVLDRIVRDAAIEGRIDDQGGCNDENRVAVGSGFRRPAHADVAACASYVLDKELLPEMFGQFLCHQARKQIGRATGSVGHNHAHRSRRIGLRPCNAAGNRQRGKARCQMQNLPAAKFHGVPSRECGGTAIGWQRRCRRGPYMCELHPGQSGVEL